MLTVEEEEVEPLEALRGWIFETSMVMVSRRGGGARNSRKRSKSFQEKKRKWVRNLN